MTELQASEIEAFVESVLLVDGDRDHMNQSRLTCKQTQLAAKIIRQLAREALRSREGQVEGWSEDAAAIMLAALKDIEQRDRGYVSSVTPLDPTRIIDHQTGCNPIYMGEHAARARAAIAKATSAPPSPPIDLVEVKLALEEICRCADAGNGDAHVFAVAREALAALTTGERGK